MARITWTRMVCTLLTLVLLIAILSMPHQTNVGAASQAQTQAFYRLRVTFSSSSDWANLIVLNPDILLSIRVQTVEGKTTSVETQLDRLSVAQTVSQAELGNRVGIIADYALDAGALDQPLRLALSTGAMNSTRVNVAVMDDGTPTSLNNIFHQSATEKRYEVDLSSLQTYAPETAPLASAVVPHMLWAFYYTWYEHETWSSPELLDHPLNLYDSNSPLTLRRQIEQAQSVGIDGFISSWWGPGHQSDHSLSLLLDEAHKHDFSVMIYFETLGNARSADDLYDWLSYFIATYRDHPAYYKIDGKPVIVPFWSIGVPLHVWTRVFTRLHEEGLDAVYLAMSYDNIAALDLFDGLYECCVWDADLDTAVAQAGRATHFYHLLDDNPTPRIFAPTVQPGFDDRLLPERAGSLQERENGLTYRRNFDIVLAHDPDWIFINSWNEWWENSHIEPGELYGTQYLDITREYASRWKGE